MTFSFRGLQEEVAKAGVTDREVAETMLRVADQWGEEIAARFREAVEALRNRVDLSQVAALLEQGRFDQALQIISAEAAQQGFAKLAAAIVQAATAGARVAAAFATQTGGLPGLGGLAIAFDETNPETAAFLRRYSFGLIRQLSAQTQEVAAEVLREGITSGSGPRAVAVKLKDSVGLTANQRAAVANFRRLLEAGDRGGALDRALRDKRFDPTVRRMGTTVKLVDGKRTLVPGKPLKPEQIDKMVGAYLKRSIAHRALTISRTEAVRAMNIGQRLLWQQQIDQGLVLPEQLRRKWIYTADDKVRHAHETIPRRNPKGVGWEEAFDSELGAIMYPGDPEAVAANTVNCRCTHFTRLIPLY